MADIVKALLAAPVNAVLLVAGLAFLGVAVFRRITDRLDAGPKGRLFAALIGVVLVAISLYLSARREEEPKITNCTKYSASGDKCLRCEFDIDAPGAQQTWIEKTCTPMLANEPLSAEFKGRYEVTNRGAGSDCWLSEDFRGVDGLSDGTKEHTNVVSCAVDTTRTTGYVAAKAPGQGTAAIKIVQCQWGGNPNMLCRLSGKLSIYSVEGQP